jgi:8-oxo-dGTP diphosphatase
MSNTISSTLGFIFDSSLENVLLITKNRPDWQNGKINGIGGKNECDEEAATCITREVREETSLQIPPKNWIFVGTLNSSPENVSLFTAVYSGKEDNMVSMTDEQVRWYPVNDLPKNVIPNLRWLIPLCLDKLQNNKFKQITIEY